jgi:hypothetical protein
MCTRIAALQRRRVQDMSTSVRERRNSGWFASYFCKNMEYLYDLMRALEKRA